MSVTAFHTKIQMASTSQSDFKAKLIRSLRWQYLANLGVGVLGAVYVIVLARIVGAYSFGIYAILTGLGTLLFNVFDLRLQEQVIYFHAQVGKGETNSRHTIAAMFAVDVVARPMGLIVTFVAGIITVLTLDIAVGALTVFLAALSVFVAKAGSTPAMGLLRVRERLNIFVVAQLVDWVLRLLSLAVIVATGRLSLANVLGAQCLCAVVANLYVLVRARREYHREYENSLIADAREAPSVVRNHWRKLAANQGISVADSVVREADTVIVGYLLSVEASGLYKMAKNFAGIAWRAADPVFIVVMPILSQFWAANAFDELNGFVRKLTVILAGSGVILYGLSCVGATVAVKLVLGPAYWPSAQVFPVAALWLVVSMPLIWTHPLALATARADLQTWASAIGSLIGLAVLCLGTLYFGLWGAALGLSVAYSLPFVIAAILLRKAGIYSWSK